MSQMFFRKKGKISIHRDDKEIESPDQSHPVKGEKGEKAKKKGKGEGKTPLHLIPFNDVDPLTLKWEASWNKQ